MFNIENVETGGLERALQFKMVSQQTSVEKLAIHPNYPDLKLSQVIYGTWRLLDDKQVECTPELLLERIKHCISQGVTTFDLADIYGGGQHQCERVFGQALALEPSIRAQIQLITKCGIVCPDEGQPLKYYDTSKEYILQRVHESLETVGCGYFDVFLVHRPDPFMDPRDTALAMQTLRNEGKVRYFGVSNFNCGQVEMLQSYLDEFDIKLVTNQIEMSPLCLDPLYNGILEQCLRLRMKPMIWSPLAGGRLFSSNVEDQNNEDKERIERLKKCLKEMATETKATPDQLCYSWLMAHPSKPLPIVGSNKMERIDTAVQAAVQVKMTRKQWFRILEASNGTCVP